MKHGVLAMILACAGIASAQSAEIERDQSEWLTQAEELEDASDPRGALDAWRHVESARPGSRLSSRARDRIAWITERAEGDFAPLATLMRFTAMPQRERDHTVVSTFEGQIASMPAGRVRIEARLAASGEWARLGETERALDAWALLLDEPTLESSERELVHESMARARLDAGDASGAMTELEDADLADTGLHHIAARAQRATVLVPLAWSVLAAFALAVALAVRRAGRGAPGASITQGRLVLSAWIGVVPWLIARAWADESSEAFAAAGAGLALIVLASFVLGESLRGSRWRAPAASLAVLASIAVAYLAVVLRGDALPFA